MYSISVWSLCSRCACEWFIATCLLEKAFVDALEADLLDSMPTFKYQNQKKSSFTSTNNVMSKDRKKFQSSNSFLKMHWIMGAAGSFGYKRVNAKVIVRAAARDEMDLRDKQGFLSTCDLARWVPCCISASSRSGVYMDIGWSVTHLRRLEFSPSGWFDFFFALVPWRVWIRCCWTEGTIAIADCWASPTYWVFQKEIQYSWPHVLHKRQVYKINKERIIHYHKFKIEIDLHRILRNMQVWHFFLNCFFFQSKKSKEKNTTYKHAKRDCHANRCKCRDWKACI